jgi:hypothetical protein
MSGIGRTLALFPLVGCGVLAGDTPEGTWDGSCDVVFVAPGIDEFQLEYTFQLDVTVEGSVAGALWTAVDADEPVSWLYEGVWAEPMLLLDSDFDELELTLAGDALIGTYGLVASDVAVAGDCQLLRIDP